MDKLLTIVAILLFATSGICSGQGAAAQDSGSQDAAINQTIDGKRQGKWVVTGKSGKTEEGMYVDGKKDGKWTTKAADGTVRSVVTFVKGIARGEATYYYADGTLMESGVWNIDHWEGSYSLFYENGAKACEFSYNKDGKREGRQLYFHKNGKVMYDGKWANGKISGTLTVYNEAGVKTMERNYDENGKFTNSVKMEEKAPDEKIQKAAEHKTSQFNATGQITLFNKDGKREQSGQFVNGKLVNGEKYIYNSAGKLTRIDTYKNGKLVSSVNK